MKKFYEICCSEPENCLEKNDAYSGSLFGAKSTDLNIYNKNDRNCWTKEEMRLQIKFRKFSTWNILRIRLRSGKHYCNDIILH